MPPKIFGVNFERVECDAQFQILSFDYNNAPEAQIQLLK